MAKQSAHTRPHENDPAGVGALLRSAREGRGLTLEQISQETKIPRRHLEALEHGNVAAVPDEFYRRAEIRAFARAVRLDQNIALGELERPAGPSAADGAFVKRSRPQEPKLFARRVMIAIAVIGAAAVFGRAMREREPALENHARIPQQTQFDRVIPPSPSGGSMAVPIEATVPASAASNGDPAAVTRPAEAQVSADSVTELVVTSEPAGARVTVNGIGWGITPVTIRYLPAGDKRVRVTKQGFAAEERIVRLAEGHPSMVDIQLRNAP